MHGVCFTSWGYGTDRGTQWVCSCCQCVSTGEAASLPEEQKCSSGPPLIFPNLRVCTWFKSWDLVGSDEISSTALEGEMKWKDKLRPHPDTEEMWLLLALHHQPHLHTEKGRQERQHQELLGMCLRKKRVWLLQPPTIVSDPAALLGKRCVWGGRKSTKLFPTGSYLNAVVARSGCKSVPSSGSLLVIQACGCWRDLFGSFVRLTM